MMNADIVSVDNMYFDDSCFFVPNRLFCQPEVEILLEKENVDE